MSEAPRLIQIDEIAGQAIVRFTSRQPILSWGFDQIESVAQQLFALVGHSGRGSIILDFQGVEPCLPASFEAKLVALHMQVERAGGTLKLCNLSPSIQDQFSSNRLIEVFHIFPTPEDAPSIEPPS